MKSIKIFFIILLSYFFSHAVFAIAEDHYLKAAKKNLEQGNVKTGVIYLKNHLMEHPDDAYARHMLGFVYLNTASILSAEKELEKAYRFDPKNTLYILHYIQVLQVQKKYHQIIALLDPKPKLSKEKEKEKESIVILKFNKPEEDEKQLEYLSNAYIALNKLNKAEVVSQKSEKKGYISAYLSLARIAILKGNLDKAASFLGKVLAQNKKDKTALKLKAYILSLQKKRKQALTIYDQLIEEEPKSYDIYLKRARLYLDLGLSSEAEKDIKVVLKVSSGKNPQANYLLSWIRLEEENFQEAQKLAEKALDYSPKLYEANIILGAAHYYLGNKNQADKFLSPSLNKEAPNLRILLLLSDLYMTDNNTEKLVFMLDGLDYLKITDIDTLLAVGRLYSLAGEHNKSLEVLYHAIALEPDNYQIKKSIVQEKLKADDRHGIIKNLESYQAENNIDELEADSYRVLAYITQGRYKEAEAELNKLMTTNNKKPFYYILRANIEEYKLNKQKAEQAYLQALILNKEFVPALLGLANLNYEEAKMATAKRYYQQVIDINAQHITAGLVLVKMALEKEESEEAEKILLNLYENHAGNIKKQLIIAEKLSRFYVYTKQRKNIKWIANDLLINYGGNLETLSFMANTHLLLSQWKKAEKFLRKILEKYPKQKESALKLAQMLMQQKGREAELDDVLDKAFNTNGYSPQTLKVKIALLLQNKQYKQALAKANEISKEFPSSNAGEIIKGDIFWQMKKYDQALTVYKKAYFKNMGSIHEQLAVKISNAMIFLGKETMAIDFLNQQVARKQDSITLLFSLAKLYQKQQDFTQAQKLYQQILMQDHDNVSALNNIAWLYFQKKNLDKALYYAEKAYRLKPNLIAIADTYGVILFHNNAYTDALSVLTRAAKKSPETKYIKFHLAQAYAAYGNKQKAIKLLEAVLSDKKTFSSKQEAEKLLNRLHKK